MKNKYFQRRRWLFFCLCLSAAAFLFLLVALAPQYIGQHQLRAPQPPYIGNPGEVTLEIYCWRKPDQNLLRIEPLPDGLEASEETLQLTGISLKGFRWQSRRLFWAVQFGEYPVLPVICGPLKFQLPLQLKILPRPDLSGLEIPPPPPAPVGKTLPILLFAAFLAIFVDLLLTFRCWNQPHSRALRQLDTLPANTAGCAKLWHVCRRFSAPSSLRCWLSSQIRMMQFSPAGLTPERFALCKALLRQHLILNNENTSPTVR
jgi:hypothetical protein